MSEAWGTTGRVTLREWSYRAFHVYVDEGKSVGNVAQYNPRTRFSGQWFASRQHLMSPPLPSRDAAVMWVLRRTAPDVWRAERPVVWRVAWQERYRGWCAEGPKSLGVYPGYSRIYYRSNDDWARTHPWRRALTDARYYARGEYARAAR